MAYAQHIHIALNREPFDTYPVTASFGVSCAPMATRFDTLFNAADAALYHAKQQGRNRVSCGHKMDIDLPMPGNM